MRLLLLGVLSPLLLPALLPAPARGAEMQWAASFRSAMEEAQAEQKFVMVDFFTHWCYWCKVLDQKTFTDPNVVALSQRLVNVRVNAESEVAVAASYGVRAYPTVVFLNPDGTLRQRVQGFQPPEGFAPILQEVLRVDRELFALAQQVRASPEDLGLRIGYSQTLAQSGRYAEAAAQLDSALALDPPDLDKAGLELDRWINLYRSGSADASRIRKGLEKWLKKGKQGPRRLEGEYYLARAEEGEGRMRQARKRWREITNLAPGSWFAEEARSRLTHG